MGLEADHAVDDVDSGTFQYPRPGDVGLLVESGLDLHDGQHLLAGLSGVNEGVDDGGVARGAVQGLLDGQDLRIVGGLLDEPLHAGGEGVVRVVHQDVTTTNGRKHVCRASCLDLGQVRMGDGQEVRVGQVVTVDVGQGEQAGEIKWGRKPEDLLVLDVELTGEQGEHLVGDVVLHLEAYRGTSHLAAQQLLLEGEEQVFGVVLLDLEVLVACDAEGGVLQHMHAGEQLVQVTADDLLEGEESSCTQVDQTR